MNMVPESVTGTGTVTVTGTGTGTDMVAPKLYTAIVLPTPFSVVSKMVVVLLIFGAYLTGIVFYTLYEGKYHFDGRMMWNFLMDHTDDISYPNASAKDSMQRAQHVARQAASIVPSVPSVPSVPFHSATQRAERIIEDETFVGSLQKEQEQEQEQEHVPVHVSEPWATTWILRPLQRAQMRLMAWTHIRGNTLYSRKLFI